MGVSCDGPRDLHDPYRLNWNGRTTHLQTVRSMDLLRRNGIKYKIIAVVNRKTLRQPEAFYNFFFRSARGPWRIPLLTSWRRASLPTPLLPIPPMTGRRITRSIGAFLS